MKLTDKFEKCAGIYIFTNLINGKVYVGEALNIQRRIYKHLKSSNQIIHKATKKHGIGNFEITVYYLPDFDKKSLVDLETQLINKFDCLVPKGYNVCLGGSGFTGGKHSEESKSKLKKATKNF